LSAVDHFHILRFILLATDVRRNPEIISLAPGDYPDDVFDKMEKMKADLRVGIQAMSSLNFLFGFNPVQNIIKKQ
jgi:hypothetical protein